MLTCRELTRFTASGEMEKAGWKHRALARLHRLMCRHCHRYLAQMREIGAGAREPLGTGASGKEAVKRLSADLLARIPRAARSLAEEEADRK